MTSTDTPAENTTNPVVSLITLAVIGYAIYWGIGAITAMNEKAKVKACLLEIHNTIDYNFHHNLLIDVISVKSEWYMPHLQKNFYTVTYTYQRGGHVATNKTSCAW